ncbi:expressed unknown protein [Seminavis robusta]|uniref:Uncharacterized protein n=1 Tax=Seminavis robusta TaxID=568900 RepID=A0A9N8DT96_9STRA|nr:expressed unknown protein [Seminavis robusta]|eukprot:Sro262_g101980.1 n/a (171) ;mRNA; r:28438-28950
MNPLRSSWKKKESKTSLSSLTNNNNHKRMGVIQSLVRYIRFLPTAMHSTYTKVSTTFHDEETTDDPPTTIFVPAHKMAKLLPPVIRASNISQGYFYDKIMGRKRSRRGSKKNKQVTLTNNNNNGHSSSDGVWQEASHVGGMVARWAAFVLVMMLGMSLTNVADIQIVVHY